MRFKWLKYTLVIMMLLTGGLSATTLAATWEQLKTERADAKTVARDEGIELKTARMAILVTLSKPTNVKVYTILGQLVSSETLPAGISQLHIPSHGVYIVKIGSLTCKVAL